MFISIVVIINLYLILIFHSFNLNLCFISGRSIKYYLYLSLIFIIHLHLLFLSFHYSLSPQFDSNFLLLYLFIYQSLDLQNFISSLNLLSFMLLSLFILLILSFHQFQIQLICPSISFSRIYYHLTFLHLIHYHHLNTLSQLE